MTRRRVGLVGMALLAACASLALVVAARADGGLPILHEFLPPDPAELPELGGAPGGGGLAATVDTPSGPIAAPDLSRGRPPGLTYGDEPRNGDGFRPDRDTRRPTSEKYDDPFTPQLTPFKRFSVYDAVREDYTLYVRDPVLRRVPVGEVAIEGGERFFADLSVDLVPGQAVRIPSVAPGAFALRVTPMPPWPVELLRDGAENWFVRSSAAGTTRLVLDLVAPREAFAADYPDVPWRALPPFPPPPASQRAAYERVAAAVGLGRQSRPREVVTRLTEYFRSFAPSDVPPTDRGDIYLDLALSKKGVCRHRAFAFLVTALHAGVPARVVTNEAHAWVEVRDDRRWRRIDLGGAAVDLEETPHLERPRHVPPPDQFGWPNGRDGGDALGARERAEAERSRTAATPASSTAPLVDPGPAAAPAASDPTLGVAPPPRLDGRPAATVTLDELDRDLFRGKPLRLRGRVTTEGDGERCGRVRVDVVLRGHVDGERRIGSLATDDQGRFEGAITLPRDLPVGDYDLVTATAGNARCGAGRSN